MTSRSFDRARLEKQAAEGIAVITVPDIRWERVDIKSVALLPNVLAKQTARDKGAREAWLVDAEGRITEGASSNAWTMLRKTFPGSPLIAIDNEHVLHGETPKDFAGVRPLHIAALPAFLRSIVQRTNFSFTHYLRTAQDSSSELHQWTRANYTKFRNLEKRLKLHT